MAMNDLTLDDASAQLAISRRALSSSIAMLGLKTTRGADRRAYLSSADVERIQAFRSGQESKLNPMYSSGSITYANVPQPQQMPRSYKSYAKEAYRSDPTYYKAASYVITNGAAIPPKLFTDATMQKEITSHPMLDLLEQPNNEQSGVDYREAVIGFLLIAGNSFQYASRVTRKNGPPDELWNLPPDLVHPVTQKPRGVIGYNFDPFDKDQNPIPPELICHLKFWAPDDIHFGLSPVEPAAILMDQNAAARRWNLAVLQNGGRMDGAWTTPVPMGVNERNDLEKKLAGKYRGYSNAGKAPVLDGGLKFNPTAYTPTELDWLESIRRNEGGIANVVNIPPQLIGDTSATTYNNMGEAKAASYTEEIFPVLDRIYAGWRRWLMPMFGLKGAYLYYDKESVEVVQQVIQTQKNAQADRAVKAYLGGLITLDQANILMGMEELPNGQGQVYRIGLVLVPAEKIMEYAEQSLKEPAAPPMAIAEPLNVAPAPAEPGQPAPQGNEPAAAPPSKPASSSTEKEPISVPKEPPPEKRISPPYALLAAARRKQLRAHGTKAASSDVTHIGPWECMPGACDFCLENDGEIVAVGEAFPNGASSPEDCHRFCKCEAYEMSIPDGTDTSGMGLDELVALFAVGFIASRHDKDVQEYAAQQEEEDDGGEEDDTKTLDLDAVRERKQSREDYRAFMLAALK